MNYLEDFITVTYNESQKTRDVLNLLFESNMCHRTQEMLTEECRFKMIFDSLDRLVEDEGFLSPRVVEMLKFSKERFDAYIVDYSKEGVEESTLAMRGELKYIRACENHIRDYGSCFLDHRDNVYLGPFFLAQEFSSALRESYSIFSSQKVDILKFYVGINLRPDLLERLNTPPPFYGMG